MIIDTELRLLKEMQKHPYLVIAVDFDNTVYDYHKQGLDLEHIKRVVAQCHGLGHEVFAFTCNQDTDFVKDFFEKEMNIPDIQINTNSLDHLYPGRKPFFNVLLDDRAGLHSALADLQAALAFYHYGKL